MSHLLQFKADNNRWYPVVNYVGNYLSYLHAYMDYTLFNNSK